MFKFMVSFDPSGYTYQLHTQNLELASTSATLCRQSSVNQMAEVRRKMPAYNTLSKLETYPRTLYTWLYSVAI